MANKQPETSETIIAYKGFDKDWSCRGFQYGEPAGQTFSTDEEISLCNFGFHACEAPFDVWNYYRPSAGSKYAQVALVALSGVNYQTEKDTKRVGRSITLKASLTISALINAQVEWVFSKAGDEKIATGDSGHAAATGNYGHAAATGNYGHAVATGHSGNAAATGYYGHAGTTGHYGHAGATGHYGNAAATGEHGHAATTGCSGHAVATGHYGHAAATGNYGHAATTGDSGHAVATGNHGHAVATGDSGHAVATGDHGHAAATGDYGCSFAGFNGRAKASARGSFAIAYYDEKLERAIIIVGTPGIDGIKADTWYCVKDGELQEVE